MAQQQELKESDEQLHWFWKLTTKWWFFPVFYVSLALVLTIIVLVVYANQSKFSDIRNPFGLFALIIIFMPGGLVSMLNVFSNPNVLLNSNSMVAVPFPGLMSDNLRIILTFIYHPLAILSVISIFKNRKKILKWLILTLLFTMLLSFSGCIVWLLSGQVI